ncbi:hypothetical protein BJ165DRAFT_1493822 [Panaeolus papilionaceus]|nr:hypothetical protein BJ165DRAFT_1493822 [Panaeolus papilionaceus]
MMKRLITSFHCILHLPTSTGYQILTAMKKLVNRYINRVERAGGMLEWSEGRMGRDLSSSFVCHHLSINIVSCFPVALSVAALGFVRSHDNDIFGQLGWRRWGRQRRIDRCSQ